MEPEPIAPILQRVLEEVALRTMVRRIATVFPDTLLWDGERWRRIRVMEPHAGPR